MEYFVYVQKLEHSTCGSCIFNMVASVKFTKRLYF